MGRMLRHMTQSQILSHVLEQTRKYRDGNGKVAAVFDLDSTLFNVAPRITSILREFATHPEYANLYPEECRLLARAEQHPRDWGIEITLQKIGLRHSRDGFFERLHQYWLRHFHASSHLHHDEPVPGSQDYVRKLHEHGAHIHYLTGRDIPRYGEGTPRVLLEKNFPLHGENVVLALKPDKNIPDAPFKRDYLARILSDYEQIWFFENEPVNVNLVLHDVPEIKIVFFDSTHSGKEQPHESLVRIKSFALE